MAKVFLSCLSPFNPKEMSFTSHSSSSLRKTESATSFASLIHDLNVLTKSLEDESISLKWCSEAMLLIKTMHSHFLLLLSNEVSQVSSSSWDRVEMVEEYLKESLDLLGLFNLLKSAISGFDTQTLMADFTIQRSMEVRVGREKSCRDLDIQKWKEKSLSKIMMVKSSTIPSAIAIVSFIVFCSVLNPTPIKIDRVFSKLGPHNSFSGSIKRLVGSFLERFQAAEVEKLWNRSVVFKEGLELFISVVDEVFDDVIEGRKKVIGLIGL